MTFHSSKAVAFADVISRCNFIDLAAIWSKFTRVRNCQGSRHVSKRLNHGRANCDWWVSFRKANVEHLSRHHSYQNLILLHCGGHPVSRGVCPFWFEVIWMTHPDYMSVVKCVWIDNSHGVVPMLEDVKKCFIRFNKEVLGNIFKHKCLLEGPIKRVQCQLEVRHSSDLQFLERKFQDDYDGILKQKEIL